MENVIEFDVRNADQKRVNIGNYTMECVIMDQNNQLILTADVDTNVASCSTGIGVMMIDAADLEGIKPQFLKYTLYILNQDGSKTPVYGDTQFGLSGTVELIGGVLPENPTPQIIDTFITIIDDTIPGNYIYTQLSDAVEVNPKNDIRESHSISLEFRPVTLDATVTVQITTDVVVSTATDWEDLETFTVSNTTDRLFKVYNEITDYSNNIGWLRIKYIPLTGNTGKFDKILVIA